VLGLRWVCVGGVKELGRSQRWAHRTVRHFLSSLSGCCDEQSINPERLRHELTIRGLDAIDLARNAHTSPAAMSAALAGKPISASSLRLMAGALQATPVDHSARKPPSVRAPIRAGKVTEPGALGDELAARYANDIIGVIAVSAGSPLAA
jgi:transcriptional regulator with XRE-family HTH domain